MWYTTNKKAFAAGEYMTPKVPWLTLQINSESLLFENSTTLGNECGKILRASEKGGDFTKIGIVAPTQETRDAAKLFFSTYFLYENSLPSSNYTDAERTITFTKNTFGPIPTPFNKPPFVGLSYVVNGFSVETFETIEELTNKATLNDT